MIIAFGHRKRMGKDQSAKFITAILREHPNYRKKNIARRGFADALYDICYKMYSWAGFQRREYYEENGTAKEQVLPVLGKSPRQILIDVGNHMRQYDPGVWMNITLRSNMPDVMVITDLRYPNEFTAVQAVGGACVKINNPRIELTDDVADCALDNQTGWDFQVENDGSLQDLYDKNHYLLRILGAI